MGDSNYILLLCEELFKPLIGQVYFLSNNKRYIKPARDISKLFRKTSKKHKFFFGKTDLLGLVGENDQMFLSANSKSNKRVMLHEKFHLKMLKEINLCYSNNPYILEDAFAESYAAINLKTSKKQRKMAREAERTRKIFNDLVMKKNQENIEKLVKDVVSETGSGSYLEYLHDLQYYAYLDLGLNFFKVHGVKKTIKYLAVAEKKIEKTEDHRVGVEYLNSKLPKKKKIFNILNIKNLYYSLAPFLNIESNQINFEFYARKMPFNVFKDLALESFYLLLPELSKEDSVEISPNQYKHVYEKLKEDL